MFTTHKASLCFTLAFVTAVAPSVAVCQSPGTAASGAAVRAVDASAIVPEATFAAVAFPRRVLTSPEMWMMPTEVLTAMGMKEFGVDPLDIEQMVVVAQAPSETSPPGVGAVVHLAKPYQIEDLLPNMREMITESTVEGKPYLRLQVAMMGVGLYMPDERTIVVGTEPMPQAIIANRAKPVECTLSRTIARLGPSEDFVAVLRIEPLRPLLNMQLAMAPIPAEFADLRRVPDMVDTFAIKANLTDQRGAMLSVTAKDEAAAIELEKLIGQWLVLAQQQMQADMADELARAEASDDPVEQATARYTQRVSSGMFEMFRPVRKGNRLILDGGASGSQAQVATIGILIALLLPAVQAARGAARRASSINNMKQLGLCMHNYHDAHRKFPARAVFDKNGKPLLSWRVMMLPYIDDGDLYGQFRLDEAWDSPHNLKLAERMPAIFRNPSSTAPPNTTTYLAPVGPGTLFEGNQGRAIRDITDGTSNTVLLVEANDDRAVLWTKPDDWTYDPQAPMAGLGSAHPRLFNVLLADGSVQSVSADLDVQVWKALLSRAGGERINGFFEPSRR